MTTVAFSNVLLKPRGEEVTLPPRRRRLSTIMARHAPKDRAAVALVFREDLGPWQAATLPDLDRAARLRADWSTTLVGPRDTVVIVLVPLGGGGRGGSSGGASGGQNKSGLGTGLAIASIALIALAPFAAPALGLVAGSFAAVGAQAGMVVAGLAVGFAAQRVNANKKQKERNLTSITGGGNIPRPGERKTVLMGRCWTQPPLSQKDVMRYDGDDMILIKRMTLCIDQAEVHAIHVGESVFWTQGGGIQSPYNGSSFGTKAGFKAESNGVSQVEILYGQPSTILPGDVTTSPSVSGQPLPRGGGNPAYTPWFRAAPVGVEINKIQLDYQWTSVTRISSAGRLESGLGHVKFEARRINTQTGEPTGESFILLDDQTGLINSPEPIRRSTDVGVSLGAYEVRAQNVMIELAQQKNDATWDGLRGHKPDARIRPQTTEIVMRVRSNKSLGIAFTAFSDVWVEATGYAHVYRDGAWYEEANRKAIWSYARMVRASYMLGDPASIDQVRCSYYAGLLSEYDTFDGVLENVSSWWEAASEVLGVIRADPVKIGRVHSLVRDEPQDVPRHVLTRRQTVADTAQSDYLFSTAEGAGDVIVQHFVNGDSRKQNEVRATIGGPSRTPKRYQFPAVATGEHAMKIARWLAAVATYRDETRTITTEWDGRLVYPGDLIHSDVWFLDGGAVYGIEGRNGNTLTLDSDANFSTAEWGFASIRSRAGREWGLIRAKGDGKRGLILHSDDVAAQEVARGMTLGAALASDHQQPTTIRVSSDLTLLQRSYIAKSAVPGGPDDVRIEMLNDAPEVWAFIGETIILPSPPTGDWSDPVIPDVIGGLSARVERIETTIEAVWGLQPARGAVNYRVRLSYDDKTWEQISDSPSIKGRVSVRQTEELVYIDATPVGRTGLSGPTIKVAFSTIAPEINASLVKGLDDRLKSLFTQVVADVEDINKIGGLEFERARKLSEDIDTLQEAAAAELQAALDAGQSLLTMGRGLIRDEIMKLHLRLDTLANDMANEIGNRYEKTELHKIQIGRNYSGVKRETELRIAEDVVIANDVSIVDARLVVAETGLVAQATVNEGFKTSITNIDGKLTSTVSAVTIVQTKINDPVTGLLASSSAIDTLESTTSQHGADISTKTTQITALQSTVNNPTTGVVATASNVGALTTSVKTESDRITAVSNKTTALETTVNNTTTRMDATATLVESHSTIIVTHGNQLSSVSQRALVLEARVDNEATGLVATSTAVNTLTTRVTNSETGISTHSIQITGLQSTVYHADTGVGATANALATLKTKVNVDHEGRITSTASSLSTLTAAVNNPNSGLSATAANLDQIEVSVGWNGASATKIGALEATVNDTTTGVNANASMAERLRIAVGLSGYAVSDKITELYVTTGNHDTRITNNAAAVSSLNVAVGWNGASATAITSLRSDFNGHTANITNLQGSYDGVKVKWGVAWEYNGNAQGGIALTGMVRNDGSGYTSFGIHGDAVITGTLSANKIQTNSITASQITTGELIVSSAQIGNLVVGNRSIANGAVSVAGYSSTGSGTNPEFNLSLRAGDSIMITGHINGSGLTELGGAVGGHIRIMINGDQHQAVEINCVADRFTSGSNNNLQRYFMGATPISHKFTTGSAGNYNIQLTKDTTEHRGGMLWAVALSK